MNPFGHIDQRVRSMEEALPFYEALLPALGFTRPYHGEAWKVFAAEGMPPGTPYFAFTEDPDHRPSASRIAFWVSGPEEVDRIGGILHEIGATITGGPARYPYSPSYYAVYFEDPSGNPLEVYYRVD
jgi:catechol 2,3-dioxygenase-like lactoylglutathione lyase family enzyme